MAYEDLIEESIATGNHWKAKEQLQGRLSGEFDADVCEAYGRVLLAMHDDLEAGRFLFASGKRKPEYEAALGLYLDRYADGDMDKLLHSFPKSLQRLSFDQFPTIVASDLEKIGFRPKAQRKAVARRQRTPSGWDSVWGTLILLAVILLLAGFAVSAWSGLRQISRWMFE